MSNWSSGRTTVSTHLAFGVGIQWGIGRNASVIHGVVRRMHTIRLWENKASMSAAPSVSQARHGIDELHRGALGNAIKVSDCQDMSTQGG